MALGFGFGFHFFVWVWAGWVCLFASLLLWSCISLIRRVKWSAWTQLEPSQRSPMGCFGLAV